MCFVVQKSFVVFVNLDQAWIEIRYLSRDYKKEKFELLSIKVAITILQYNIAENISIMRNI